MIAESAQQLRRRLRAIGLSSSAIRAAWPRWWNPDAENSSSARADLRFSLARNLGLDPRSLIAHDSPPQFVWRGVAARFKNLSAVNEIEQDAITSYGKAIGALLVKASPVAAPLPRLSAMALRNLILNQAAPFVRLSDLLAVAWSLGIPVIHLTVFPWRQKRMAAMTVRVGDRYAVLLAKDSSYPAPIAFYLGHELGHIALSHLASDGVIVDFEEEMPRLASNDPEEEVADRFALELLTGEQRPHIVSATGHASANELARVALASGPELRIEPGTLALGFGYSTSRWKTANAALKHIYSAGKPASSEVNLLAIKELALDELPDDALDYLQAVLGVSA